LVLLIHKAGIISDVAASFLSSHSPNHNNFCIPAHPPITPYATRCYATWRAYNCIILHRVTFPPLIRTKLFNFHVISQIHFTFSARFVSGPQRATARVTSESIRKLRSRDTLWGSYRVRLLSSATLTAVWPVRATWSLRLFVPRCDMDWPIIIDIKSAYRCLIALLCLTC
jgi:hypothetical protein